MNAGTDAETTSYFARVHPHCVGQGLELFSVMLRTPRFLHLETERAIVLEEALGDFNAEGEDICADNRMSRLLWGEHPLGQPVIGTPETIRSFGAEEVKAWYARHYVPNNMVISVAGPVDPQVVEREVSAHFGAWTAPRVDFRLEPPSHPFSGPGFDWIRDSDSQLTLQLAWRTSGRACPHAAELRVLRRMLGEGGASLLMQKLREDAGLTYSVEASLEEYPDCGCFSIDLSTEPENLVAVVKALLEVVTQARKQPKQEDLDMLVRNALNHLDFSRDNVEDLAGRYGWGVVSGYMRTLADDVHMWSNVSAADVADAAATSLIPEQMGFVCIGPWRDEDRDEVENLLSRLVRV
jgi:predicted Zn-dependent peptidase